MGAGRALADGALRPFYENAFHAAEHLALAELFSYAPTAEEISNAKTHQTARSTYQLCARLENADVRFAQLLGELDKPVPRTTIMSASIDVYSSRQSVRVRAPFAADPDAPKDDPLPG